MATEKLCLKWNDFQNIVETSFSELRSSCDFTDVTLACEDQSIKAHKVILSACSPFFKRLLKAHPNPQPLIYMRGLRYCDLEAVVDFIYRGETNIDQEQLENFLQIAEELELQGLTGGSRERESKIEEETPREYSDHWQKRDVVKAETKTNRGIISERSLANVNIVQSFMEPRQRQTASIVDPDTKAIIESMIEKRLDKWSCTRCDFKSNRISNAKEHAEKHIEGLEYPCDKCKKVFRSSLCMRKHRSKDICQNK